MENKGKEFSEYSSQILEIEDMNDETNLMEIGLSSIQIIKYINQLNKDYNLNLTIIDFLENPTINKLFEKVNESRS